MKATLLKAKRAIKKLNPKQALLNHRQEREYKGSLQELQSRHRQRGTTAVVIHLFYLDNWPLFRRKLLQLKKYINYDLYITIPDKNQYFIEEVRQDFPAVEYLECPNRGRDVLPFLKIAKQLDDWGYRAVLKFHSKKSTHWEGGQSWLEITLDQIIPSKKTAVSEIGRVLLKDKTGVIGPDEFYYPLTVNFPANGLHMSRFVAKHYGRQAEQHFLQTHRSSYGFFGGTMLWMKLDAIRPLLRARVAMFEPEAGQIDGTYAHAVERLLSLLPQIEERINYSSNGEVITKRPYKTNNIPEWSTDHDKG